MELNVRLNAVAHFCVLMIRDYSNFLTGILGYEHTGLCSVWANGNIEKVYPCDTCFNMHLRKVIGLPSQIYAVDLRRIIVQTPKIHIYRPL